MRDKKIAMVIRVLLDHWISELGNPDVIVTNEGKRALAN